MLLLISLRPEQYALLPTLPFSIVYWTVLPWMWKPARNPQSASRGYFKSLLPQSTPAPVLTLYRHPLAFNRILSVFAQAEAFVLRIPIFGMARADNRPFVLGSQKCSSLSAHTSGSQLTQFALHIPNGKPTHPEMNHDRQAR